MLHDRRGRCGRTELVGRDGQGQGQQEALTSLKIVTPCAVTFTAYPGGSVLTGARASPPVCSSSRRPALLPCGSPRVCQKPTCAAHERENPCSFRAGRAELC